METNTSCFEIENHDLWNTKESVINVKMIFNKVFHFWKSINQFPIIKTIVFMIIGCFWQSLFFLILFLHFIHFFVVPNSLLVILGSFLQTSGSLQQLPTRFIFYSKTSDFLLKCIAFRRYLCLRNVPSCWRTVWDEAFKLSLLFYWIKDLQFNSFYFPTAAFIVQLKQLHK